MKQTIIISLVFACTLIASCSKTSTPTATTPQTAQPLPLIIDHSCTDLARVPAQYITRAKAGLRITYGHTSHGSQLVTGMDVLMDSFPAYQFFDDFNHYRYGGGNPVAPAGMMSLWDYQPGGDLGNPDRTAWSDATDVLLSNSDSAFAVYPHGRNLVLWSWCGQVSSATSADIDTYLTRMSALETAYPSVRFVYMTGHLDGSGAGGNLNLRNEQIRTYCRAHGKLLYDFAEIESYDPDGATNFMPLGCNDNCDYDSSGVARNWAASWLARNPNHQLTRLATACGSCAHSQQLNCVLKGRAFWWLAARVTGWDGR